METHKGHYQVLGTGSVKRQLQRCVNTIVSILPISHGSQCVALRSEVKLLRGNLRESEELKDKYYSALVAAENRLDRWKSNTVAAIQSRTEAAQSIESAQEELPRKTSSPEVSSSVNWWEFWPS